jgi:hypothetical protein
VVTASLLPLEIYELANHATPFKIVALVVNVAVVVYLLIAKRLFGLRGGLRAEEAEREREEGWPALEQAWLQASNMDAAGRQLRSLGELT